MKNTFKIVAALTVASVSVSSCASLAKMEKKEGNIAYSVTPEILAVKGGNVDVKIDATIPAKYFAKDVELKATPVLVFSNGNEATFESKALQGEKIQGNAEVVPYATGKTVTYMGSVPYEEGMRISDLKIKFYGTEGSKEGEFTSRVIAEGVNATETMVANSPRPAFGGDEFQRITQESEEAAIYYLVNSSQVRGSEVNSKDFKSMNEYIKAVKASEDKNLKNIQIQSYASPDGAEDFNAKLAKKREEAADKTIKSNLKKAKISEITDEEFLKKYVVAEDWEGFKKAMEESDIQDKDLILRVLSMHSDPEVREREIKNISSAFNTIAKQILPKLRRSKFIVNAEKIGKSDEEIKSLAKGNPSALNVEELLYSATLFDSNDDKLAIYETAMKQFPSDWRGFNDAGLILFKEGDVNAATTNFNAADRLSANNKTIKNNLGAIQLKAGDVENAEVLFGVATGIEEADYNKGIVAIMNGEYTSAVNYFKNENTPNAALASLLAGNVKAASQKLEASKCDCALASYLKAVVAARNDNAGSVLSNLKDACAKNADMKALAATDLEFAAWFDNSDFKAIVE